MADNKTRPYTNSTDNNKTQVYKSDPGKTETYSENAQPGDKTIGYETAPAKLTDKTITHGLGVGDEIELNDNKYTITGIISGENQTGEAVIYKIEDAGGKAFALKLYYKFTNPKDEPNPEALSRIKAIRDPDILKLHDFGTGANKYKDKFCFEICDYAEGLTLLSVPDLGKKYTPEFIRSNVIPEIFKGIRTLHDYKIYHCDLKPENVFYLDKEQTDLIIGDYGSAKTFEQTIILPKNWTVV
ncbi:MAG: protein kinase domain-containing protein [Methanosarcinaceae archaeon]